MVNPVPNQNNESVNQDVTTPLVQNVVLKSPISVIQRMYQDSKEPSQRQACLRYLLHYQHYNAEFTQAENQQLQYPAPLIAGQATSGYVRTDRQRLKDLIAPRVTSYLGSAIYNAMIITSPEAIRVLKTFYPSVDIIALNEWPAQPTQDFNPIVIVEMDSLQKGTPDDSFKKQIQQANVTFQNKTVRCLFILQIPGIECTLMWGAKYHAQKKSLECVEIKTFFDNNVGPLLNNCGATPDRLAVNEFVTQGLGADATDKTFSADLRSLGITKVDRKIDDKYYLSLWRNHVQTIKNTDIADPGIKIYRDAIVAWHEKFPDIAMNKHMATLLYEQVLLWTLPELGIVQWVKGYQNLCEIILLSLDYFTGLMPKDFEKNLLNELPQLNGLSKSVTLYSYGMSGIFNALSFFIDKRKNKKVSITCMNQNYFETFNLLAGATDQNIAVNNVDSLDDIDVLPQVLVADIHPNNAERDVLFQNDIVTWLKKNEPANGEKITLILDITLNDLHEAPLQKMLTELAPLIASKKLEIYLIQSLAKFMQLGADNLSGGLSFYIGNRAVTPGSASRAKKIKQAYFQIMMQDFKTITQAYFSRVRENSSWVYRQLIDFTAKTIYLKSFCAAKVTLNVDEATVYVAISFHPFFDKLNISDKDKSKYSKSFHNLLLTMAATRGLPITARQTIGLSLSVMNLGRYAIRFTIGVENREIVDQYLNLIKDFNFALSQYTMQIKSANEFNLPEFVAQTIRIDQMLATGESQTAVATVPTQEVFWDDEDNEGYKVTGNAQILYKNGTLRASVNPDTSFELKMSYSRKSLFKMFFKMIFLKSKDFFISNEAIESSEVVNMFLHYRSRRTNEKVNGNLKFAFTPIFSITAPNGRSYKANNVFLNIPALGTHLVQAGLLDHVWKSRVYAWCVQNYMTLAYQENESSIVITFQGKIPTLDYKKHLSDLINHSGIVGLVNYINELDFDNIKPPIDYTWNTTRSHFDALLSALDEISDQICEKIDIQTYEQIALIENSRLRAKILLIIFMAFNGNKTQAKYVSQIFSDENLQTAIDYHFLTQVIFDIDAGLKEQPDKALTIKNYMTAIYPIIKLFFSTPADLLKITTARQLKRIAKVMTCFSNLLNRMRTLEKGFPDYLRELLPQRKSITQFLAFYMYYPLTKKLKDEILDVIKSQPAADLKKWLMNFTFYYCPMESFQASQDDDCMVVYEENQFALKKFFDGSGLKDTMLLQLSEAFDEDFLEKAARLYYIMQDDTLGAAICLNIAQFWPADQLPTEYQTNYFDRFYPDANNFIQMKIEAANQPAQTTAPATPIYNAPPPNNVEVPATEQYVLNVATPN
jgi:hypothetical protein